jgi:hypothetical protein
MKQKDKLIRVYSGNEMTVNLLKGRLEIAGIYAAIQNDSGDSFFRGVPAAVDLYIQQSDFKKAEPIISEFIKKNKA